MQLCDSFILRARGLWGLTDAAFDGDFGLLVLGYSGGGNLSGRMLRGHVSGDVNMGQTITVVRAGDGGRASEAPEPNCWVDPTCIAHVRSTC